MGLLLKFCDPAGCAEALDHPQTSLSKTFLCHVVIIIIDHLDAADGSVDDAGDGLPVGMLVRSPC